MDVSFCLAALEEVLAKFGRPEIFNTDQGSQFTSTAFTGALNNLRIAPFPNQSRSLAPNVIPPRFCMLSRQTRSPPPARQT